MHLFDCLLDFIFNEERSMKLLIAHLVSISKRPNLLDLDLFADVPHGKTKQSTAGAKTLDAAWMREMLSRKRWPLLCSSSSRLKRSMIWPSAGKTKKLPNSNLPWSSGFPSPPFPCFLTIRGGSRRSFDPGGPLHTR